MSNPIIKDNNFQEQNYFSRASLLKNFLAISIIYISLISIASYYVYSTIISYSLFIFSLLLFILRVFFVRGKISYNFASLATISIILFLLVPICAFFSGGLYSPILWWYIIVPIISLLLFGRCLKTNLLTATSLFFILIFIIIEIIHYKLPTFDTSRLHVSIIISLFGLFCLAYTITWIFEMQKSFAYKKLNDEKERLKASEAGFRDIFDNTDELIQNISFADGKFLMVNPTWLNTLEYSGSEVENLTFKDIIHSDNNDQFDVLIAKLKEDNAIDNIQIIFKTKSGKKIFVEGETGVMMKEDIPFAIRGIFRNITEKRIAQDDVIKSRAALEQAQELAQLGSWEINLVNNISTWSKEMYRIFGIESYITGELLGHVFTQKLSADNNFKIKSLVQNIFEKNEVSTLELIIKDKDNIDKHINLIGEPLLSDNNKKIIGVKGTAQDITEQKMAVLAKSNFLSTMSHEIRTPINGVLGIANLLKSENLTDIQRGYVETLHLSSEHLLSIVSEILDFSKMDSGSFTFEQVPFNVYDVCKKIFDEYEVKAIQRKLRLNFSPDSDHTINVKGDKKRLVQVLCNLISNAIKFTEEGEVNFNYSINNVGDKTAIIFSIKDTGIGISAASQSKIFDTFSQVDETTTRAYGGTGLGLAITKRLVNLQHGKLYLNSELGKGTTFFAELNYEKLPASVIEKKLITEVNTQVSGKDSSKDNNIEIQNIVAEEKIEPTRATTAPIKLEGMRILIAEDNAVNAMVLTRFLTKWGVVYDVAKNGQLAIDRLEISDYDLILMDLQMPVLGGREATKIIRNSTEKFNTIPIIALTADAILDAENTILKEGFNECILKPFNPDALYKAIALYYN